MYLCSNLEGADVHQSIINRSFTLGSNYLFIYFILLIFFFERASDANSSVVLWKILRMGSQTDPIRRDPWRRFWGVYPSLIYTSKSACACNYKSDCVTFWIAYCAHTIARSAAKF